MRKLIISLLSLMMLLMLVGVTQAEASGNFNLNVKVDGQHVNFPDQKPIIQNGRTLVTMRPITEAMGLEVGWEKEKQKVTLSKEGKKIELIIGKDTAKVNEQKSIELDVPACIIGGRTMVPLRFIGEGMDVEVDWNDITRTVNIITTGQAETSTAVKSYKPNEENSDSSICPKFRQILDTVPNTSISYTGKTVRFYACGEPEDDFDTGDFQVRKGTSSFTIVIKSYRHERTLDEVKKILKVFFKTKSEEVYSDIIKVSTAKKNIKTIYEGQNVEIKYAGNTVNVHIW